jgi:thiamine pyrophosphate-dependent acetolactate synthase large subunit-like protein
MVLGGDGGFPFSGPALLTAKKYGHTNLALIMADHEFKTAASQRRRLGRGVRADLTLPGLACLADFFQVQRRKRHCGDELIFAYWLVFANMTNRLSACWRTT